MHTEASLSSTAQPTLLLQGQGDFARTPAAQALERGDFEAALRILDEQLIAEPESLINRLWWVRCQYELQSLPVTALSSPLEEMFPAVSKSAELAELAVTTYALVGMRLRERSYSKLGAVICEKAVEICRTTPTVPAALRKLASGAYRQILEEEFERAKKRGESKTYLVALEKQIEQQSRVEVEAEKVTSNVKQPRPAPFLTAKALREEADRTASENSPEHPWKLGEAPKSASGTAVPTEPSSIPKARNNKFLGLLLVAAAGFAAWMFLLRGPSNEEIEQRLAMLPAGGEILLKLPEIVPRLPDGLLGDGAVPGYQDPSFDSLTTRLEKLGQAPVAPEAKPEPAQPAEPESPPVLAAESHRPEPLPPRLPPASSLDPRKAPLLNPDTLKGTPVESLGGDPHVTMAPKDAQGLDQNLERGRDGQLYGPPVSLDGGRNSSRDPYEKPGTALDGSQIRSYAVDRFPTPLTFKTITATNVLDAPSVLAPAIDRISSDAVIKVIARMGKWLELQSTGGRRGFIYAQDAVEVKTAQ